MNQLLVIFILSVLLAIVVYEDFRFRSIHVWIFPFLFVSGLMVEFAAFEWNHIIFNLSFLLLQFILLTLWFSLKEHKFVWITQGHLGLGDLVFWVSISGLFSPVNFTFFFLFSLTFSLLLALVFKMKGHHKIPLAGFQGLALLLVVIVTYWRYQLTIFRNDTPLLNFILS